VINATRRRDTGPKVTDLLGTPKPMGLTQQSRAREGATPAESRMPTRLAAEL